MLAAIFDANLDTFDIFTLVAAVILLVAAFLARPDPSANPPAGTYATALAYLGLAVLAFGFLFLV